MLCYPVFEGWSQDAGINLIRPYGSSKDSGNTTTDDLEGYF